MEKEIKKRIIIEIADLIHTLETNNYVYMNGESNVSNWKGMHLILFLMYLIGALYVVVKDYWILTNLISLSLLIYKDYKINNLEFDRRVVIENLKALFKKSSG